MSNTWGILKAFYMCAPAGARRRRDCQARSRIPPALTLRRRRRVRRGESLQYIPTFLRIQHPSARYLPAVGYYPGTCRCAWPAHPRPTKSRSQMTSALFFPFCPSPQSRIGPPCILGCCRLSTEYLQHGTREILFAGAKCRRHLSGADAVLDPLVPLTCWARAAEVSDVQWRASSAARPTPEERYVTSW